MRHHQRHQIYRGGLRPSVGSWRQKSSISLHLALGHVAPCGAGWGLTLPLVRERSRVQSSLAAPFIFSKIVLSPVSRKNLRLQAGLARSAPQICSLTGEVSVLTVPK